jgi:hypothetical protein
MISRSNIYPQIASPGSWSLCSENSSARFPTFRFKLSLNHKPQLDLRIPSLGRYTIIHRISYPRSRHISPAKSRNCPEVVQPRKLVNPSFYQMSGSHNRTTQNALGFPELRRWEILHISPRNHHHILAPCLRTPLIRSPRIVTSPPSQSIRLAECISR